MTANMMGLEPRDAAEEHVVAGLLKAFGLPKAFLYQPNPVNITAAARRQGAICFFTELGGGATVNPALIEQARHGLLHLLGYTGVLRGELVPSNPPAVARLLRSDKALHYVYAMNSGLWEPLVELGATVKAGQPAALIHFPDEPLREPVQVLFNGDGEVVCKRATAQVQRGDCVSQLAGHRDSIL